MFKKNKVPTVVGGKIENVLGENTSCEGTLKAEGNIRVDGVFRGRIETAGNVIVGPKAQVLADIVASAVQVWGAVRGDIAIKGRLEILPSGRVWGDVKVASLLIDKGGIFRGQCVMAGEDGESVILPDLGAGDEALGSYGKPTDDQADKAGSET